MHLSTLTHYPVKSCRGSALTEAVVEPWGLAGDRRWMIVDDAGAQLTAREYPQLLLVDVALGADGALDLAAPDVPALHVEVPTEPLVPVRVWRSAIDATAAAPQAHAWFGKVLGRPARLVYLDDPTRRATNPAFSRPDDRVSFADGYPLLLTTTASLAALNEWQDDPLPMTRFRPNVVVDGAGAWDEDGWRVVRIGDAVFRAVKGCDRCVMTTIDPVTAEKGKEPIRTLARMRRWDGATWFGMNLVPDTPGAIVRVGDEVEILHAVPAPDGPPR